MDNRDNNPQETKELKPHEAWLNKQHPTGCQHKWVYDGHSHNDDAYRCSLCKILDFY